MQKIGHIPASYLNVTSGGIYYVAGQNKTLEWMSFDGRIHYTIVPTATGPFNLAGRWIFYVNRDDGDSLGGCVWTAREIKKWNNDRIAKAILFVCMLSADNRKSKLTYTVFRGQ